MDAVKKAQSEKYIVAALLVVFVAVFVKGPLASLGLFRSKTPVATPAPTSVTVTVPVSTATAARPAGRASVQPAEPQVATGVMGELPAASGERKAAYTAQNLRSPFESLLPRPEPIATERAFAAVIKGNRERGWATATISSPQAPSLSVTGMLWGGAAPKAIINGKVYQVHDMVEGVKVVAIDRRGVTFDHNGTPIYLKPAPARLHGSRR